MPLLVMSPGQVIPSWEDFVDSLAANEHQASKHRGLVILSWSLECHTTLNAIPCIFIYNIYIKPTTPRVLHILEICSIGLGMWFGNLLMDVLTGIGSTSLPARTQRPHRRSLRLQRQLRQLLPMLLLVCVQRRSFRQAMPLISHWRGANTCWKDSILQFGSLKCVNFNGHIPLNLKFVQVPFYCFIQLWF